MSAIDAILIEHIPGETQVALLADGTLVELWIERPHAASHVGDVYLGRVRRVDGRVAFVDVGLDRPGFLDFERGDRGGPKLHEGAAVPVQVTRDPVDGKGPGLSAAPRLAGRHLDYCPGRPGVEVPRRYGPNRLREKLRETVQAFTGADEGFALRVVARGDAAPDAATLAAEADALRVCWKAVGDAQRQATPPARLYAAPGPAARAVLDHPGVPAVCDDPGTLATLRQSVEALAPGAGDSLSAAKPGEDLFARHDVHDQIEDALTPRLALSRGGALVFGTTAAVTAIDVDSGGAGIDPVAVNRAAVPQVARQIRLRNLAGLIVVDPLRTPKKPQRRATVEALRAALADDPVPCDVLGMTPGGLIEVTRKRTRPPLDQLLLTAPPAESSKNATTVAFAALRAARRQADAAPGPLRLRVPPEVLALLQGPLAGARDAMSERLGGGLALAADPALAADGFAVERG
jgi:Rne/Rng family ribonuclease